MMQRYYNNLLKKHKSHEGHYSEIHLFLTPALNIVHYNTIASACQGLFCPFMYQSGRCLEALKAGDILQTFCKCAVADLQIAAYTQSELCNQTIIKIERDYL